MGAADNVRVRVHTLCVTMTAVVACHAAGLLPERVARADIDAVPEYHTANMVGRCLWRCGTNTTNTNISPECEAWCMLERLRSTSQMAPWRGTTGIYMSDFNDHAVRVALGAVNMRTHMQRSRRLRMHAVRYSCA